MAQIKFDFRLMQSMAFLRKPSHRDNHQEKRLLIKNYIQGYVWFDWLDQLPCRSNVDVVIRLKIECNRIRIRCSSKTENNHLLCKWKYYCMAYLFDLFGVSCFAYVKWTTVLLVWLNPNQSNRRSAAQRFFPYGKI